MKKAMLCAAAAAVLLVSGPSFAGPKTTVTSTPAGETGWTQSSNANANACFGQARAYFAQYLASIGESNGEYISQRGGNNPQNNDDFIAAYCAATGS